jgi:hypothetical protein
MIPNLQDLLNQFNQIPLNVYAALFFITGSILILVRDWRISVAALLFQYLSAGIVLAQVVRAEIAFAKVLVGLFVCLMLYLSARQAGWRHRLRVASHGLRALLGQRKVSGTAFPPGRAFRLMALLLMALTAVSLSSSYPLPDLPAGLSLGFYWLMATGVLILILTEEPLKTGQGLLTLILGFELWYTALEDSLLMVGLLGTVNLLLALAIGYLASVRGVVLEEDF